MHFFSFVTVFLIHLVFLCRYDAGVLTNQICELHTKFITGSQGRCYKNNWTWRASRNEGLAKRLDNKTQAFHIGGKDVPITLQDVQHIMGLPIQGYDVNLLTQAAMNHELITAYASENKLMLSDLEHMIPTSSVPDDDFIRHFVLFTIGVILAPITKEYVHSKYLAVVADVVDIPKFNWGQFTLTNLLGCINEYVQFQLIYSSGKFSFASSKSYYTTRKKKLYKSLCYIALITWAHCLFSYRFGTGNTLFLTATHLYPLH